MNTGKCADSVAHGVWRAEGKEERLIDVVSVVESVNRNIHMHDQSRGSSSVGTVDELS